MAYRCYHTSGLVLASYPSAEASRELKLLTPEFGLVTALAQGLRENRSKLRYHLQDFSHLDLSLVRGRNGWRLTGAWLKPPYTGWQADREKLASWSRINRLVRRLVRGEARLEKLFDDLIGALEFLASRDLTVADLANLEKIVALRLLDRLGYLRPEPTLQPLLDFTDWAPGAMAWLAANRPLAEALVAESLGGSQL